MEKGELLSRQIHHESGSILNIMELSLSKGLIGTPHYNLDRDEVILILKGKIEVLLFDSSISPLESKFISADGLPRSWTKIKKNTIHQLRVVSNEAIILEIIGGVFFQGSCIEMV